MFKHDIGNFGYTLKKGGLSNELSDPRLSKIQKRILENRLTDEEYNLYKNDIDTYMYNALSLLDNIDKIPDLDKSSDLLEKHINKENYIAVVTDYDADGITSAVTLYKSLRRIFGVKRDNIVVIVNKRKHGNGFNRTLVSRIEEVSSKRKIKLMITADHGSSDEDSFAYLKEKIGMDIILTDHHQIKYEKYPKSVDAFINIQRKDCDYHKDVSGCFVAFITMVAAYRQMHMSDKLDVFNIVMPYVAISTVTDVMSLKVPLNRHIVRTGLNELNSFRNKAWLAIKKVLGIPGTITPKDIGFKLGPLINTGNRVNEEQLLVTEKFHVAEILASKLAKLNKYRKTITKEVMKQANAQANESKFKDSIVTSVNSELAINGIVAANIGNSRGLPSVCFVNNKEMPDILTGSCRGIVDGLDIMKVFKNIQNNSKGILIEYGGHDGAAGCKINSKKLDNFKDLFNKYSKQQLDSIPKEKHIEIDHIVPEFKLTPALAKSVETCGPYGKQWPEPVFLTKLIVDRVFKFGTIARLKLRKSSGVEIEATHFFNKASDININNISEILKPGTEIYLAYNITIDSYLNSYSLSLSVVDISVIKER
jgi:single-stranded-DNA-specific exonuclease